ncbi:MAG: heat-inducible transcriptional repressor HrcA [Fusobacteriaceae bacterium]
MNEREKLVLNAIIDYYLTFGETIGSRALVKRYGIDFSSATIRNVMADLEDLGFIAKTHVSSGRIPTDKGYRYYLDKILEIEKLTKLEKDNIQDMYQKKMGELDSVLEKTSALLSQMTNYAGLVIEPDHHREKIRKIELVHIDDYMVMAVIVMENKAIRTKKIHLREKITRDEVIALTEEINEKFSNGDYSKEDLESLMGQSSEDKFAEVEKTIEQEIYQDIEGKMFLKNSSSILASSGESALEVMQFFNNDETVKTLFEDLLETKDKNYGKVNVIFGEELNIKGMENYSFVYSLYKVGDAEGVIGVIGPKRMSYSKTIGLVDYVSKEVNKVIYKIESEDE